MFGKIFKGIAVAAGVGFAIGFGTGIGKRRLQEKIADPDSPRERRFNQRLERLESRLAAMEVRPPNAASAELHRRVTGQAGEIEALHLEMNDYRHRITADIETVERRMSEVARSIPSMLESIVAPRVDELRLRLRSEMQQSVNASLTSFERTIDDKVSDRIAALENAMLDQSALVTALTQRAVESDLNLQRLISAVERLCDRPGFASDTQAAAA